MPRYQSPVEVHGVNKMLEEGLQVEDLEVKDLLLFILAELKVMNEHLTIVTDEEINVDDKLEV
jgi:hypothetical protein